MTDKLRVGVIGCGLMARHHIAGYMACGRYEVAALADLTKVPCTRPMPIRLRTVHYTDGRAMLDAERLDVVSRLHLAHGTLALDRSRGRTPAKAILCEKPMADTLGHADEMLVACHRNGVNSPSGTSGAFCRLHHGARVVAQGAIGQVLLIQSVAAKDCLTTRRTRQICSDIYWAT
jgi:predicted dehydrogenase